MVAVFTVQHSFLYGLVLTGDAVSASLFDGPLVVPAVLVGALCVASEREAWQRNMGESEREWRAHGAMPRVCQRSHSAVRRCL